MGLFYKQVLHTNMEFKTWINNFIYIQLVMKLLMHPVISTTFIWSPVDIKACIIS